MLKSKILTHHVLGLFSRNEQLVWDWAVLEANLPWFLANFFMICEPKKKFLRKCKSNFKITQLCVRQSCFVAYFPCVEWNHKHLTVYSAMTINSKSMLSTYSQHSHLSFEYISVGTNVLQFELLRLNFFHLQKEF